MQALRLKLKKIGQCPALQKLIKFFDGNLYPAIYAALAFFSALFGLEIFFYSITVAIIVFTCLFSSDTKPIIAPVVLTVYSTSWKHTPQPPYNSAFFNSANVLITISVLAVLAIAAMVFRLLIFKNEGGDQQVGPSFKSGLLALAVVFVLNGSCYAGYEERDLFLGILIAVSFVAVYFYLLFTLRRDNHCGSYCAYLLCLASAVIFLQLLYVLLFEGAYANGTINKDLVIAGWGMSNNVGGMLAMFLPAPLYFAYKNRKTGFLFYIFAFIQFLGICLTQSRSSVLVGGAVLIAAAILLSAVRSPNRKTIRIINIAVILIGAVGCAVFFEKIRDIFAVMFDRGFSDSNRFQIWLNGLKNYLKAPLFGVGFYAPFFVDINIENWIFPDMYHNIIIQILACCGTVGIFAYALHVSQILQSLFRRATAERLFFFGVVLLITGTSLLDNHIFHVFPALIYSLVLLLWEREISVYSPLCAEWKRRKLPQKNFNSIEQSV